MDKAIVDDILKNKAIEVKEHLTSLDYRCTHALIPFGINFTVFLAGRTARFTIFYKPKNDTWKFHTLDEWVKNELQSKITPLLGQQATSAYKPIPSATIKTSTVIPGDPSSYFETAIKYLHILQPFANEYIDFAIICEQVKVGIRDLLNDSRYTHLDQLALQEELDKPISSDFLYAKEYLTQCLKICQIPMML